MTSAISFHHVDKLFISLSILRICHVAVSESGVWGLTFACGLHSGGGVDRVPEQTVARHLDPHHARRART